MTPGSELLMPRVVTVSASYGAGGSVIAPGLAERLGLPFFDRLLQGPEAQQPDQIIERLSEEERQQAPPGRVVTGLGHMSAALGIPVPVAADLNPSDEIRRTVEASVKRIANGTGGVILGRGAVVVLAGAPNAFHVRLDGPVGRRTAQGMTIEGVSEDVARDHQARADRAWSQFGQRLFNRDFTDYRLYHLVLDSTAVPMPECISLVAGAASAFWERAACR
jgi:cytidylate kinase